jgi:hypothetical protein
MKLNNHMSDPLPGDVDPDEREPVGPPSTQVPLQIDPYKYAELGAVQVVSAPGGVMIAPGEPAQPSDYLTEDSFICSATPTRPACIGYAALLLPAEGIVRGFERPLQIRRLCTRLASQSELLELTDATVYACTLRSPQDENSAKRIEMFEGKQRKIAEESAQKSGEIEI